MSIEAILDYNQHLIKNIKRKKERKFANKLLIFYTSVIPFNVVKNPEFSIMVEKITKFEIGLKPPSYHEIRVTYLDTGVTNVLVMRSSKKNGKELVVLLCLMV